MLLFILVVIPVGYTLLNGIDRPTFEVKTLINFCRPILTLTLTLKIVYLDTTDILQLNYYVQHIGNKKNIYI